MWTVDLLSHMCRTADDVRTERAAPDPGAARPGLCPACGSTSCLGGNVIPTGICRRCAHALYTGYSALRPPAAPWLGGPLWRGRRGDLPQLGCVDAVVLRVS